MTDQHRAQSNCSRTRERLSAFLDGELSGLERPVLEEHVHTCDSCRQEMERFEELSRVLRTEGRRTPKPPSWATIEIACRNRLRPRNTRLLQWRVAPTMAASLTAFVFVVLIAGLWFGGALSDFGMIDGFGTDQGQVLTAGLPGLDLFLKDHRAEEVSAAKLLEKVSFSPQVPATLPGGFQLAKIYVFFDTSGSGCCSIYLRGTDAVSLLQKEASCPPMLGVDQLESCMIAGQRCRKGGNSHLQVVQIGPGVRNLTLITRPGLIDPAEVVQSLPTN